MDCGTLTVSVGTKQKMRGHSSDRNQNANEGNGRLRQFMQAQVLIPVLITACFWLVMSLGTNLYLQWVESQYNQLFSNNLQLVRAAGQLSNSMGTCVSAWIQRGMTIPQLRQEWARLSDSIDELSSEMQQEGIDDALQADRAEVIRMVAEVRQLLEVQGDTESATGPGVELGLQKISSGIWARSLEISERNSRVISVRRQELAAVHSKVVLVRVTLLLLGLPIGILLGWRVSLRLQSNVAQIAVTLSGQESVGDSHEMTVSITRQSTFEEVHRQAERVVERLRSVGRELQSARKEVIQSERLAAVGELAAGVAHELRNPLTSVKLLLQHAARQPVGSRIEDGQLMLILEEVRRMETTIQGLLDFSRTPSLNHIQHDLRETLQRSLNLADGRVRQAGVQLQTALSATPLWVNGDAEQLNQVFVNLLLNAIEATPPGGVINVSARALPESRVIRVSVSDTGPGIAPEIMGRLFEPFATTRAKGTGLGLPICHRIVTEHKGSITVENMEQGGARLIVDLPASGSRESDIVMS